MYVVAGPTASGKSAYALKLAEEKNGVVINADSMQVYKDIPILTAHPSADEQSNIPHKLYAVMDSSERCNAARWSDMARVEIEKCFANGQTPIVTGGTGFYIRSLMEGLSPIPDVPEDVRSMSIGLLDMIGAPALHAVVSGLDPKIGEQLEENDGQRLAHAWAVYETTGKPLSEWQDLPKEGVPENWQFDVTLILPDREELKKRIETRFNQMLEEGVMDEVETLHNRIETGKVKETDAIIVAHGFTPLRDYLQGNISFDEAKKIVISDTKQYAKRQYTWFRHQIKESDTVKVKKMN